jgi:hypothetical protein
MLFAPETSVFAQLSHLFMSLISIRGPQVKFHWVKFPPTFLIIFISYLSAKILSEGMRQPTIHQMREKKNHRGKVKEIETFQYEPDLYLTY